MATRATRADHGGERAPALLDPLPDRVAPRRSAFGVGAAALAAAACAVVVVAAPVAVRGTTSTVGTATSGVGTATVSATRARPATEATTGPTRCSVPAPTSAAGYQDLFAESGTGWVGGDQAASVHLPDGRTLWMFGDTFDGSVAASGAYAPGTRFLHNSFVLQDEGCLGIVAAPGGAEILPDPGDGTLYWPQTGVVDSGRLVVFATRVVPGGEGSLDVRTVGTDLALYDLADGQDPTLRSVVTTASSDAGDGGTRWGSAVVTADGFHYVYGVRTVDAPLAFGTSVSLARVPVGHLVETGAWTYFDGAGFVADPAAAVVLDGADAAAGDGWSQSFSVLARPGGRFVAVYKELDLVGQHVRVAVADSPVGPFLPVTSFGSASTDAVLTYAALAHPQLTLDGDRLLVGVSRNSTDPEAVLADAGLYRPQFHAVDLGP